MIGPIGTLTHGNLMLTPLRLGDAPEMVHILADADLYVFTGGRPPGLAELQLRYEHQLKGPDVAGPNAGQVWLNWIVRDSGSGSAFGFVQATVTDLAPRPVTDSNSVAASNSRSIAEVGPETGLIADLAWLTGSEHQGCGYAQHAVEMMVYWLVGEGVDRLRAHIHPEHRASQEVADSIDLEDSGQIDEGGEQIWTWRL